MNNDTKERAYKFLADPFRKFPKLTARERQAADLAVQGLTMKEIGTVLGISTGGAESYFRSIKMKTGMSKPELAPWVIKETRKILEKED